jgi:hypothetical protein
LFRCRAVATGATARFTPPPCHRYIYKATGFFFLAGLLGTNPHITNKKKYLKYKRKEGEKKQ